MEMCALYERRVGGCCTCVRRKTTTWNWWVLRAFVVQHAEGKSRDFVVVVAPRPYATPLLPSIYLQGTVALNDVSCKNLGVSPDAMQFVNVTYAVVWLRCVAFSVCGCSRVWFVSL